MVASLRRQSLNTCKFSEKTLLDIVPNISKKLLPIFNLFGLAPIFFGVKKKQSLISQII